MRGWRRRLRARRHPVRSERRAPAGARRPPRDGPLIGHRQDVAHRMAARAGLRVRWAGFAGKLANGRYNIACVKILRQSPIAGERVRRGAFITVIEDACRTPREAPHGV